MNPNTKLDELQSILNGLNSATKHFETFTLTNSDATMYDAAKKIYFEAISTAVLAKYPDFEKQIQKFKEFKSIPENSKPREDNEVAKKQKAANGNSSPESTSIMPSIDDSKTHMRSLMMTALVKIINPNTKKETTIRALFSPNSVVSVLSTDVLQLLKLPYSNTNLTLHSYFGPACKVYKDQVNFILKPRFESDFELPMTAVSMDEIIGYREEAADEGFENLLLADCKDSGIKKIDLMIGARYSRVIFENVPIIERGELYAMKSKVGYIVLGQVKSSSPQDVEYISTITGVTVNNE